jgi:hypothetical protein
MVNSRFSKGLGFRVLGFGFKVQGSGIRIKNRLYSISFRPQPSGCRVSGLGFRP